MITILGPTACGKTALAVGVAAELGGEILSADSRQVYRRMDIGTGKDLGEYTVPKPPPNLPPRGRGHTSAPSPPRSLPQKGGENTGLQHIPYHLIDICEPGTKYNLFRYQQDFHRALEEVRSRGAVPILCGGTGLYIEAVLKGYALSPVPQNPELRKQLETKSLEELTEMLVELKRKTGSTMHNRTDVDTAQRAIRAIEIEMHVLDERGGMRDEGDTVLDERIRIKNESNNPTSLIIGVAIDREERRRRISERLQQRIDDGMVEEVRGLLDEGIKPEDLIYYGLEYKYITEYIIGQRSYDEMFRRLEIAIHQFAKRQMTWFRGMERRGFTIHWIDALDGVEANVEKIKQLYNNIMKGVKGE